MKTKSLKGFRKLSINEVIKATDFKVDVIGNDLLLSPATFQAGLTVAKTQSKFYARRSNAKKHNDRS